MLLVVLPLALALPTEWMITAVVIVTQTIIELAGELFYIMFRTFIYFQRL